LEKNKGLKKEIISKTDIECPPFSQIMHLFLIGIYRISDQGWCRSITFCKVIYNK